MTAEVAVMNTQGVAIAADSAVTISTGQDYKTYYTQQKIFNLSPRLPVGIMVYNNAEFMGINWEIVINEFSKEFNAATRDRIYDTLEEYAKHLIFFLRDFLHIRDTNQKDYLAHISWSFFKELKDRYDAEISEHYENQEIGKDKQIEIFTEILKKAGEQLDNEDSFTGFIDDGFVKNNLSIIEKEMEEILSDFDISDKMKEEMRELFLQDLVKIEIAWWGRNSSGVVFAGYGDKEIFPSVIDFRLFGKLGKNILHTKMDISDVVNDSNAWIIPRAQTDVINTFIRGMAPDFQDRIFAELDSIVEKIIGITGKKNAEEINKLKDEFKEKILDHEDESYRSPVMSMVASLPKSNLAEMAEALINLTALRRHVSTEKDDVGGPTDVALITKVDGFVWIKKKQLFKGITDDRLRG